MHIPYTFSWNIGVDFCPLIAVYLFAIFSSTVQSPVMCHVLIDFLKRNHKAFLPSLLVVLEGGDWKLEKGN